MRQKVPILCFPKLPIQYAIVRYSHRFICICQRIFSIQAITCHFTELATMNGHQDTEQLLEQFQSLCSQVAIAFKSNSQDQRSLEKHRLTVIKAAQDTLKLLQTHDELATQQTWMVSGHFSSIYKDFVRKGLTHILIYVTADMINPPLHSLLRSWAQQLPAMWGSSPFCPRQVSL